MRKKVFNVIPIWVIALLLAVFVTVSFATYNADVLKLVRGVAPQLIIGNAAAIDTQITFDGNAQDFYACLDDSADDLLFGLGSTCGTTPAISIDENLQITYYGDQVFTGTTPFLTIGDDGAEDTGILFNGEGTDNWYACSDATGSTLILGYGTTCGTTPAITIDVSQQAYFNSGKVYLEGTVPTLTVGDAGDEDVLVKLAGEGTDIFHFCFDTTNDDAYIGYGSTCGTSGAIQIGDTTTPPVTFLNNVTIGDAVTDDLTVTAALQGVNPLYLDGATGGDGFETIIAVADVGADITVTLPNATGTVALTQGVGSYRPVEALVADDIQTTADCGKTLLLNAATGVDVTLPAAVSGCYFKVILQTVGTSNTTTIATDSGADVLVGHIIEVTTVVTGTASEQNGDVITFVNSTATIGDSCELISDGTYWYFNCFSGADNGITSGTT